MGLDCLPPQVPDQRASPVRGRGVRHQHGAHRQDQLRGAAENQVGTGGPHAAPSAKGTQ